MLSRALAERGARADRARLRAAAAEPADGSRHDGDRRHRHRHPELPAAAEVPGRTALSSSSTTSPGTPARTASRPAPTSITSARTLVNLFQGAGIYAYPNINAIASDCPIGATGCTPLITGAATDLRHYTSYNQAVRPSRQRPQRRRVLHDHRLQLVRAGQLAPDESALAEPRAALRVPEVPAAGRHRGQRHRVHGQPCVPGDGDVPAGQEQLRPARRLHLRHQRHAPDGVRGGWGIYYGRTEQQRHLELADQQRRDVRVLQLLADVAGCAAVSQRADGAADHRRQAVDPVPLTDRSSGPKSTWAS